MAERPFVTESSRHPNWELAVSSLTSIIGHACDFEIEEIPGLSPDSWQPCELDAPSDSQRWDQLCDVVGFRPQASLIIVPITSFAGHGPFFTSTEQLDSFFDNHIEAAGDCVLSSGDLFVLALEQKRLILYHHSELATVLPVGT